MFSITLVAFDRDLGNYQGDWDGFPMKTPSQGVATHIRAAFDPSLKGEFCLGFLPGAHCHCHCQVHGHGQDQAANRRFPEYNGRYLSDVEPVDLDELHPHAISSREARKLWKLSEEIVGQKFEY